MRTDQIILILVILVIVSALIFSGRSSTPPVTGIPGTPVGYSGLSPSRAYAPSPYGVGNAGPMYTYGGGRGVKALNPFRNPYSVAALMVIAFAIWNLYIKKDKGEDE